MKKIFDWIYFLEFETPWICRKLAKKPCFLHSTFFSFSAQVDLANPIRSTCQRLVDIILPYSKWFFRYFQKTVFLLRRSLKVRGSRLTMSPKSLRLAAAQCQPLSAPSALSCQTQQPPSPQLAAATTAEIHPATRAKLSPDCSQRQPQLLPSTSVIRKRTAASLRCPGPRTKRKTLSRNNLDLLRRRRPLVASQRVTTNSEADWNRARSPATSYSASGPSQRSRLRRERPTPAMVTKQATTILLQLQPRLPEKRKADFTLKDRETCHTKPTNCSHKHW